MVFGKRAEWLCQIFGQGSDTMVIFVFSVGVCQIQVFWEDSMKKELNIYIIFYRKICHDELCWDDSMQVKCFTPLGHSDLIPLQ